MHLNHVIATTALGLACFALTATLPHSASADIVGFPDAEWNQGLLSLYGVPGGGNVFTHFYGPEEGPSQAVSLTESGGSAGLYASLLPSPALQASVDASGVYQANAVVELTFHVEVFAAASEPSVANVRLQAMLSSSSGGLGGAGASISLNGLDNGAGGATSVTFDVDSDYGHAAEGSPQNMNIDYVFADETNQVFSVQMIVDAASLSPGFGMSVADPVFSVPEGYSLEFSPGVGDLPLNAPEPATWTTLLIGFTGLGFMRWRRTMRGVTAASTLRELTKRDAARARPYFSWSR